LKYESFALLKVVRSQYINEVGKFIFFGVKFPEDIMYEKS